MAREGAEIAASILVVQAGIGFMTAFCPDVFTTRGPDFHDPGTRAANIGTLREGYTVAAVLTLATGIAASVMIGSNLPLAGALAVTALEIAAYEYACRHPTGGA